MKTLFSLFALFFIFSCSSATLSEDNTFVAETTTLQDMKEDFLWTKNILALWDSLTAGYWVGIEDNYPSQLQSALDENWYAYRVTNAWVSGDTTSDLLDRLDSVVSEQEYQITLLVIWANDWLRNQSISEMKDNIQEIINELRVQWVEYIVLWWMDILPIYWQKYRSDFKNAYTQLAEENGWNIYFLPYFLDEVWWVKKYNIEDGIHPNKQWYKIIVKNMMDFLEREDIIDTPWL